MQGGASPTPAAVQNSPENIFHVAGRAGVWGEWRIKEKKLKGKEWLAKAKENTKVTFIRRRPPPAAAGGAIEHEQNETERNRSNKPH